MSRGLTIPTQGRPCFPRVSGDEPPGKDLQRYLGLFSPRERG